MSIISEPLRLVRSPSDSLPPSPAVIAHRGSSADEPEHTLAAYELAVTDGADGLEADVRMTRDGHLVCIHDRRVDRTSNGHGAVSALTLADLSRLDFGSWHSTGHRSPGRGRVTKEGPHSVLPLVQLLELVTSTPRPMTLAVETKHPTRFGGAVERQLAADLGRFGLLRSGSRKAPKVQVMTFSAVALQRAKRMMPALPLVHLAHGAPAALAPSSSVWGPSIELVRRHPERVAWAHANGRAVNVWTVDDPADMQFCSALGVEGLITNRPALARTLLA